MRIVVTSQGPRSDSPVDLRFGRAQYLILADTETGECSAFENVANVNAVQGAGIQTGKKVVDLGAKAVITGHVGPKAFSTLSAAGIEVYTGASGTVGQAIEQFKRGSLPRAQGADVAGHWV
ncbi:MAG: NifB/NifX family molybdenum-iron cluster-binding protein [Phycisphaerae bacterium]